MVLGIGEGSIEILTGKEAYVNGELIEGRVLLSLGRRLKARGLRILFYGEKKSHHGKTHTTERILQQQAVLDGAKTYAEGRTDYKFSIQLPQLEKPRPIEGTDIIPSVVRFFGGKFDPYANVKWYLDASLDIPLSLDVNRKMQITVRR
ncbi:MAG: hypothetical protein PHS02_03085 [Candidatus ainarchaeum sp.]|nr:hypothetical protein [Candidatus ainarchaeum sp.]